MVTRIILGVVGFFLFLFILWIAAWRRRKRRLARFRSAGKWREAVELTRSWCGRGSWTWSPLDLLFRRNTAEIWHALELSSSGYANEAVPLLRRLLERRRNQPDRTILECALGQSLMDLGSLDEAEAAFREAAAEPEPSASTLVAEYNLCMVDLQRGDLRRALSRVDGLKDPSILKAALHLKSYLLCYLGDFDAAYREALRLLPESLEILALAGANDPESRVKSTDDASPFPALGWMALSRIAWMAGWRLTADWLTRTDVPVSDAGWISPMRRERALLLAVLGQHEAAVEALEEAEHRSGEGRPAHRERMARELAISRLRRLVGDAQSAEEWAARATKRARTPFDRHEAWHEMGQARLLAGRREEAREAFRECLAASVESIRALDARRRLEG